MVAVVLVLGVVALVLILGLKSEDRIARMQTHLMTVWTREEGKGGGNSVSTGCGVISASTWCDVTSLSTGGRERRPHFKHADTSHDCVDTVRD
jgi:hypothetical protein